MVRVTWLATEMKAGEEFAENLPQRLKSMHGSAPVHAVFKRASLEQRLLKSI